MQTEPLDSIRRVATEWFHKLDNHAPAGEYEPLLAGDDLELRFPEGTFRGLPGFRQWYERALGLFFDEAHSLQQVEPVPGPGPGITVKVVVHWEASKWTPPDAHSRRIKMVAYQTWVMVPSKVAGDYVIKTYVVDEFRYAPDSARL